MTNSSNVVELEVQQATPKKRDIVYKGQSIHLVYVPIKRKWHWSFSMNVSQTFQGDAKTFERASRVAKETVDELV